MQFETLKIRNIQKSFAGKDAFILNANFQVKAGERLAVIGRSGSGKTSLLKMIAGLSEATSGQIFLGERDISNIAPEKRRMAFIFQDQALFPTLNVIDNVTFALRMQGLGKQARDQEGMVALQKVGLQSKAQQAIDNLSGGEKQRVAFLRALIAKPLAFLLDEPFSALDSQLKSQLRNQLLELHSLWPAPLIFVTHDSQDSEILSTARLHLRESDGGRLRDFNEIH